ncbi:MAG: cytochrome c [Pyrinomonadaceae bacterium]
MKNKKLKLLFVLAFAGLFSAFMFFGKQDTNVVLASNSTPKDDDVATVYKAKCAMCHKPDASKHFDPTLSDEELIEATMKGKKAEKPPNMPAFEGKITDDMAAELVTYMKSLRGDESSDESEEAQATKEEDISDITEAELAAAAETYKPKCAMCHKADASKHFDENLPLADLTEVILNGKKAAKPPHMPAYGEKGIDQKQARVLAVYMKNLRKPAE